MKLVQGRRVHHEMGGYNFPIFTIIFTFPVFCRVPQNKNSLCKKRLQYLVIRKKPRNSVSFEIYGPAKYNYTQHANDI